MCCCITIETFVLIRESLMFLDCPIGEYQCTVAKSILITADHIVYIVRVTSLSPI